MQLMNLKLQGEIMALTYKVCFQPKYIQHLQQYYLEDLKSFFCPPYILCWMNNFYFLNDNHPEQNFIQNMFELFKNQLSQPWSQIF
ncbi:unnamed protein product (macronuclear) [Paramecium tetraurelia]|uniref:Uncharacterized protein n=1 Tax=Paramecium tetraurelia TaxID=5888 RepID=A0DNT9_PARTE|nr:uncharacterized protein GSPATT00018902001 [Paramecium tetraurelia]CAK84706.1 unnamed protein product [Paramecium tetraurelia]|eukprot:XP_001452103.1 hypothetical protein (macronuclear) [Paramecium tetraurelia strain d4-2]